ncbi:MAG: PorT family protein [Lentimicrobiaceae bacterium]|nr:PorT family protein [Lentimicrobiaceae bacterium]
MDKKFFLVVVLCMSFGTLLCSPGENDYSNSKSGQGRVEEKIFTMGPKVSLLLTDIHFNTEVKAGFTAGFGAGVFFRIGNLVHFQPEISYSLKKFSFDPPLFKELEDNTKFSTHNLSFAPMIGVSVINNEDFKFRIFFGLEGGLLLKDSYEGANNPWTKYEYGARIGLGVDAYHVTFDIGYKYLMSKNSDIISSGITTSYQRQNMIFLSLGYCIF